MPTKKGAPSLGFQSPVKASEKTMRRFGNGVRAAETEFADLIARETGRPLWHARQEIAELVERVDKAIHAFSERAGQRKLEGALGARMALRHKPHGVMAVIGPHVMPARIPADHIVPALLAGNGVVFKPSEKAPATGEMLVGDAVQEITEYARKIDADLIVVGHKHLKGWAARWWRGSTSASLIEHSPCSVLVVITQ